MTFPQVPPEPGSTGMGYTCPACLLWVPYGSPHTCTVIQTISTWQQAQEMITLLRRIAEALEKRKS